MEYTASSRTTVEALTLARRLCQGAITSQMTCGQSYRTLSLHAAQFGFSRSVTGPSFRRFLPSRLHRSGPAWVAEVSALIRASCIAQSGNHFRDSSCVYVNVHMGSCACASRVFLCVNVCVCSIILCARVFVPGNRPIIC